MSTSNSSGWQQQMIKDERHQKGTKKQQEMYIYTTYCGGNYLIVRMNKHSAYWSNYLICDDCHILEATLDHVHHILKDK